MTWQLMCSQLSRGRKALHLSEMCTPETGDILGCSNPVITGVSADSRSVRPGYLFVAIKGDKNDGNGFISDAAIRGASAILAREGTELPSDASHLPLVLARDPRHSLALCAAKYFKGQPENLAAVTGTNGKTSVAWFTESIWSNLGHRAASLGTLGVQVDKKKIQNNGNLTTADPVCLHESLNTLYKQGLTHAVIEASSHGLEQRRLDGLELKAGAFTNLSHEHLDYHISMANYALAKRRLFDSLVPRGGTAVINADTKIFSEWAKICQSRRLKIISYGRESNELKLIQTRPHLEGQALKLEVFGKPCEVSIPIFGSFQAENILCAIGLVIALGDDPERILAVLPNLSAPPGRMQLTSTTPAGAKIFIDYAHTPDALNNALRSLRPYAPGKLGLVFGCGGDRDPGKRPQMGQIAKKNCDFVIVTDDNPRNESAGGIRAQIILGCPGARNIGDRSTAIKEGIDLLSQGDVLLIAGKGHETNQLVGENSTPFDDREVIQTIINQIGRSE